MLILRETLDEHPGTYHLLSLLRIQKSKFLFQ